MPVLSLAVLLLTPVLLLLQHGGVCMAMSAWLQPAGVLLLLLVGSRVYAPRLQS